MKTINNNNKHYLPVKVRFLEHLQDFDVLCLAACGFSALAIAKETGFSVHQVRYRLWRAGVKINSYRNGETGFARRLMSKGRHMVSVDLAEHLAERPELIGGRPMRVKTIVKQIELLERTGV